MDHAPQPVAVQIEKLADRSRIVGSDALEQGANIGGASIFGWFAHPQACCLTKGARPPHHNGVRGWMLNRKNGACLAPGMLIRVELIGKIPKALAAEPSIGDLLP
jgi:hypothetical protein